MSSALIGFIGVIAGAVTTGGFQAYVARRDRKRDARVAAGLVFADLAIAFKALEPLLDGKPPLTASFKRFLETWRDERRALASGVRPSDFHAIALAFKNLEQYVVDPGADNLEPSDLVRSLERGTQVTWAAIGMEGAVELTLTGQAEGGQPGA